MSPYLLALLFSLPIVAASLAGGWLPNVIKFTHIKTQVFLVFVSGFMIGISVLHLLPHGIEQIASVHDESAVSLGAMGMLAGVVIMFGFLRLLSFHDHEPESPSNNVPMTNRTVQATWITVLAGMSVHTLFEGFALGSSLGIEHEIHLDHHDEGGLSDLSLTFAVALAVVLHKPFDALTVVGVMKHAGIEKRSLWLTNIGFAIICPFGAILAMFFLREVLHDYEHIVGLLLTFVSGAFLCVALADLLPEAFRHRHDRFKIFVAFLCGVILTYIYWLFTPHVH